MDPVVHFEIPADNVDRARKFYNACFGWTINAIPGMGYTLLHTTPTDAKGMVQTPGNINGGMLQRQTPITSLLITIQVADIDAAHKTIEKQGGKVVRGKTPVPGVGFSSYVRDSEGNTIGLIQPNRS